MFPAQKDQIADNHQSMSDFKITLGSIYSVFETYVQWFNAYQDSSENLQCLDNLALETQSIEINRHNIKASTMKGATSFDVMSYA